MKMIVGLGNPGREHENNRHNAGFMAVDKLAGARWESKFGALVAKMDEILLVKPQDFMNRSGEAVGKLARFYKIEPGNLWVIHDDLDLKLGDYKIQLGVGPKVHNGLTSVESGLGKKNFWRVRLGIDNRDLRPEIRVPGEEYVLSDFGGDELVTFRSVVELALTELAAKIK